MCLYNPCFRHCKRHLVVAANSGYMGSVLRSHGVTMPTWSVWFSVLMRELWNLSTCILPRIIALHLFPPKDRWLKLGEWTKLNNVSPALFKKNGMFNCGWTLSKNCLANTFIPFTWKTCQFGHSDCDTQLSLRSKLDFLDGRNFVKQTNSAQALVRRLGTWCCSLAIPTACQQHWKGGHSFTQPFLGSKHVGMWIKNPTQRAGG